jgi:CPA2 family monovalent cation:H+ antiporter-2
MLEIIVITIFIATIINLILTRFHIPTIIGYIATGIIITYFLQLKQGSNSEELHTIAEFGIVFLMFTIGLEFSIRNLIKMRKEVFMYGSLQVGLSMLAFYIIARFAFGLDSQSSLVISAALALSSTAIVLKILNSNRDISKEYGQRSLGILIFQDIMVIPILLMITILSSSNISMGTLLLKTAFDAIILFLALWGIGKYVLEPFFSEVVKSNSNEIFIGSVLFLVIGASTLAHSLGFSYSLGAFIAGMIIAETKYKHQVEADLIPFRDLLLGIFFITVGMQIDFGVIGEYYISILGLLTLFTIVKIAIIYGILVKSTGKRVALKTSLALFQLGEFGLVIFELAKANKLIDPTTSQILIVTITISMIITPFVLRNIAKITNFILEDETKDMQEVIKKRRHFHDHIIVLGHGRLGRKISEKLDNSSINYIAIDNNIHNVKEGQRQGKSVIFGNAASKTILESVNIEDAAVVLVALDNSVKLHLICDVLTQIATKARVIIKVERFMDKDDLIEEFPNFEIIVGTEQTARGMVDSVLKCDIEDIK